VTNSAHAAGQEPSRDQGGALAAIGAVALLVSLFLPWWAGVDGWDAFEVWDLVLAVLAVAVLVAVAGRVGLGRPRPESWLLIPGVSAVVIVVENLINRPPVIQIASAVSGASGAKVANGTGIWVALAAAIAILIGAALSAGVLAGASDQEG